MEKNGIKQNVRSSEHSPAASSERSSLRHLMLGKQARATVGANICPEDKWVDIREELLSRGSIQQFGSSVESHMQSTHTP